MISQTRAYVSNLLDAIANDPDIVFADKLTMPRLLDRPQQMKVMAEKAREYVKLNTELRLEPNYH